MNIKKGLENPIRGWLPKEPTLPAVQKTISRRIRPIFWWIVVVPTMWVLAFASLDALGTFLGVTTGIGSFTWYMIKILIILLPVFLAGIRKSRKEKQQRKVKTWMP